MDGKLCLSSLIPNDLKEYMKSISQPSYRAAQVFKWISSGVTDYSQMSDIPKALREKLEAETYIENTKILNKQVSSDGTIKYLLGLKDGNSIETVLMKYEHGNSICLSTQAGCKMGCVFCASFNPKNSRDLSAGEIYSEILTVQKDSGRTVSNIVLMGVGEPLDNFENVMDFLDIVSAPGGLNIGMRHISLSTCGLVPKIDELAERDLQLTLSVSLHAPNDKIRNELMPVNKKYPLYELIPACKRYFEKTHRRISFEYAMIKNVNDTKECALELASLLRGFICHVNLIPLNKLAGSPLIPSEIYRINAFKSVLISHGINTTVRRRLGNDIDAACGQLRAKVTDKKREL